MAYTIQLLDKTAYTKRDKVLDYLRIRILLEKKFVATCLPSIVNGLPAIIVKPVRLAKPKPYCGQHPGECQANGRKKMKATYLEWEDWVKFHAFVNRVLNRFHCNANVFTTPHDVKGKMWVRKGLKARKRYDWTDEFNSRFNRTIRVWNQGTEDQFIK